MKKQFIIIFYLLFCQIILAQKVIHNPNYINSNISGRITKIELTNKETILHFHIKQAKGAWVFIPKETYIEDSSHNGKRLYVTKSEGIEISKKHIMSTSDQIIYKLYFPALDNKTEHINFGESNPKGNWFIYKLNITKNGIQFLNTTLNSNIYYRIKENSLVSKLAENTKHKTMLINDLPKSFFGNWYDKYDTLILTTNMEYIVIENRIHYYKNIQKIGENKFKIWHSTGFFEILSLDNQNMVIRNNRLINLKHKPISNKVPKFIKGNWFNKNNKITITDDTFYFYGEVPENILGDKKYHIDQIAESNAGENHWFVLYNNGQYNLYVVRKIENEYILSARGQREFQYKKNK